MNPVRAYAAVTAAYWAFMLSDGALRMLVLLHFNGLGFSPVQLAWLFLLYELAGIVTNLSAGWVAGTSVSASDGCDCRSRWACSRWGSGTRQMSRARTRGGSRAFSFSRSTSQSGCG